MDYNQFITLLESGQSDKESIAGLQEFVNEYPYFQTAQALLARSMHDFNHVRYEKQLKVAAAYSGDRKSLYNLIHKTSVPLFKETKEVVAENPFIQPVAEEKAETKENLFIDTAAEDLIPVAENFSEDFEEEFVPPVVVSNLREETIIPETEVADDFEEPAADPHEIIRRRLNEILGYAGSIQKEPEAVSKEKIVEEYRREEVTESNQEKETEIQPVIQEEVVVAVPEVPEKTISETKEIQEDIIEQIAEESEKAIDVIDKGELEYALEASLIQSLEKLPVITKEENFTKQDNKQPIRNSFTDWLKAKPVDGFGTYEEVHAYESESKEELNALTDVVTEEIEKKPAGITQIIDRFIQAEPRIIPSKAEFYSPATQAKRSVTEDEDLVSETLAGIYRQQGNLVKAKASYQKLSLLFPEKMAYFAALISEIEGEINNLDKKDL